MAKRFPPGPCVHCLAHVEKPTSDHVFPKSWYPQSTPPNIEKWQMPACQKCNLDYGKLEDDLLQKLSLCLDDAALGSLGLGTKVTLALDPSRGRDDRDREIRARRALKLLGSIRAHKPSNPLVCMTPNTSGKVIGIEVADLERIGRKIIRGLVFVHLAQVVDSDYEVFCTALPGPDPAFNSMVAAHGAIFERGPGIHVSWLSPPEKPICGAFVIRLFGRFDLCGGVTPRGYLPRSRRSG